jgi:hypothetical protein
MMSDRLEAYFETGVAIEVSRVFLMTREQALSRIASGELYLMAYEEMYA